jgi:Fatty acid desaturase
LLAVHIVGYLTAVFVVLSPSQAVVFLVVQQGLFGVYLGSSFAHNHKGMPVLGKDEKVDFLRRQVLTSRNIRGSVLTDLALGGLNYQIEHHLFPWMPRPSLRHAQAPVRHSAPSAAFPTRRRACWPPMRRCCATFTPLAGRLARNRLLTETRQAQMRPLNRVTQKTPCGPRLKQAHTGDNEPLPRRCPASPGNQSVQRSRPGAACRVLRGRRQGHPRQVRSWHGHRCRRGNRPAHRFRLPRTAHPDTVRQTVQALKLRLSVRAARISAAWPRRQALRAPIEPGSGLR